MRKLESVIFLLFAFLLISPHFSSQPSAKEKRPVFWEFQSIDTMKYSRDLSREKLNDFSFDQVINQQVEDIAKTGATHIGIATPYDEEFLPFLKRWIGAARKYRLKVWFRGNWSGWEKWFDYPAIDRKTHLEKTQQFIIDHRDLFEDGDIFTACPECENGGPGDPRNVGDVSSYRKFLIDEYQMTKTAFEKIGKKVKSNYDSMNGDVANLVMDKETTRSLDGIVAIDHYVANPDQMVSDIQRLAKNSGGKIVLGEFGAPIEAINGWMSEEEQAAWIEKTLTKLVQMPEVVGVNYWVNIGGSTQLWNEEGEPRQAVGVIDKIFSPPYITGTVKDEIGQPIPNAIIRGSERATATDSKGNFLLPYLQDNQTFKISAEGYTGGGFKVSPNKERVDVVLKKEREDILFKIKKFLQEKLHLSLKNLF